MRIERHTSTDKWETVQSAGHIIVSREDEWVLVIEATGLDSTYRIKLSRNEVALVARVADVKEYL